MWPYPGTSGGSKCLVHSTPLKVHTSFTKSHKKMKREVTDTNREFLYKQVFQQIFKDKQSYRQFRSPKGTAQGTPDSHQLWVTTLDRSPPSRLGGQTRREALPCTRALRGPLPECADPVTCFYCREDGTRERWEDTLEMRLRALMNQTAKTERPMWQRT